MSLYDTLIRPILFQMDPEKVHNAGLSLIASGLVETKPFVHRELEQKLFGLKFGNPLGLAAGFDKDGVAVPFWHKLGFGFIEIGTVTWHPQPGNPQPRLFRLPSDQAIINRFGFNNEGAMRMEQRRLLGFKPPIPLGINLGKSKITPLERAAEDYRKSFERLHPHGDYFVVNVSSPNTPGLRSLQERGPLIDILAAMRSVTTEKPIFIKVSPDLEHSALDDVVEVAYAMDVTGLIATNTTLSRSGLAGDGSEAGGLSGAPLRQLSNQTLKHLAQACGKDKLLIGVGGIFTGEDLYEKIALGAHLCQLYTGWVYGGPGTVPRILEEFVAICESRGVRNLGELRGSARSA